MNYLNDVFGEFLLFDKYVKDVVLKIKFCLGDVLFIFAFWFYYVYVSGDGAFVVVNVFFCMFELSVYNLSDIYGNKDLVVGKEVCDFVLCVGSVLDELFESFCSFYVRRVVKVLVN